MSLSQDIRTGYSYLARLMCVLALLIGSASLLNSCSIQRTGCCTVRVTPSCCITQPFQRRPPVMVDYPPIIVDFAPDNCGFGDDKVDKAPVPAEYLQALQEETEPYKLTKGDVLEISVFTSEENGSGEVVVAPDGRVYFQFLDGIPAEGRTAEELAKDLEKGLEKIYAHPSVAVVPKVKAGEYYMVLGKVVRPGVYPLRTSVDLRSAIGEAGGLNDGGYRGNTMRIASLTNSFIVRDRKRLDIDFQALVHKGDESQNIFLKPGDYVYIASALDDEVFIMGPFLGRSVPFRDGLSLIGALSPVYGANNPDPYARGNWHDVLIIRGNLDCPCVIRADFMSILAAEAKDVYLLPGDIVYVPNQQARFGKALIRLAIDAFVSGFTSSAADYYINQILQ